MDLISNKVFSKELATHCSSSKGHHREARERAVQARYYTHPRTLKGASNDPRRAAPRSADLVLLTPLVPLRCSGDCHGRAVSAAQSHKASPSRRFMWRGRITVHFRLINRCIPRRFSTSRVHNGAVAVKRPAIPTPCASSRPGAAQGCPVIKQEDATRRPGIIADVERRQKSPTPTSVARTQGHHQMSAATPYYPAGHTVLQTPETPRLRWYWQRQTQLR